MNAPKAPGVPHIRIPRAALALCQDVADLGALLDLYQWADDNRYKARKLTTRCVIARWGMNGRKCEELLGDLIEEGLVELAKPGTNRRGRHIRVRREAEYAEILLRREKRRMGRSDEDSTPTIEDSVAQEKAQDEAPTRAHVPAYTPQPPILNNNPPTPQRGDLVEQGEKAQAVDKPVEKKKRTRKRKADPRWLTVSEACAVETPPELLALPGYAEASRAFLDHRITNLGPKGRATVRAVELVHLTMLKSLKAGVDPAEVIGTFHKSIMSNWTGVFPPKKPSRSQSQGTPDCPLTDSRLAWEQITGSFTLSFAHKTPGDFHGWWLYKADSRVHDALCAALIEATGTENLPDAWGYLRKCNKYEQNTIMGAFRRCWEATWAAHVTQPQLDCRARAEQAAAEVAA